ncbi:MAG: UPF0164 family protein [Calditrichaeota bacterium]|nr:UPF0164 family protein [Calditrichota bacterium]
MTQGRLGKLGSVLLAGAVALLVLSGQGFAQKKTWQPPTGNVKVTNVGTNAAAFLEIGVGARAVGMGSAFVATANDATAMYWNPAGIGRLSKIEATFTHASWFVGTNFDYAGFAVPVGNRFSVGASVTYFGFGEQPVRVVGMENGTGEYYSAGDVALAVALALNLTDRFSFGFNGKYIEQKIWHCKAHGAALDVGFLYQTLLKGLTVGMSVSNFGTEMRMSGRDLLNAVDPDPTHEGVDRINVNYATDSFPLPVIMRFGVAYQRRLGNLGDLRVATDVLHPSNSTESLNLGVEYLFGGLLELRAGYQNLFEKDSVNGLTYGAGIRYATRFGLEFRLDYAYADWGFLRNTQRVTATLAF